MHNQTYIGSPREHTGNWVLAHSAWHVYTYVYVHSICGHCFCDGGTTVGSDAGFDRLSIAHVRGLALPASNVAWQRAKRPASLCRPCAEGPCAGKKMCSDIFSEASTSRGMVLSVDVVKVFAVVAVAKVSIPPRRGANQLQRGLVRNGVIAEIVGGYKFFPSVDQTLLV